MRTNQLRIGNYLQGNNVVQVTAIFSESTVGIGIGDPYHVHTEPPFKPCLLPIPLTEEWLVKLGFNPAKKKYDYELGECTCEIHMNKSITFFCSFWLTGITIQYVHQLQNLYFALTGEELTI